MAEVIDSYPRGTPDRDNHPWSFHVPLMELGRSLTALDVLHQL
jgi:hypothetical protein